MTVNKKSEDTIELLKNGLIEAMNIYHFDDITVTQITQYSDVSRKTFYHHFNTKSDLLDKILYDMSNDYVKSCSEVITTIKEFLNEFFSYWNDNEIIKLMLKQRTLWKLMPILSKALSECRMILKIKLETEDKTVYARQHVAWSMCWFLHKWALDGFDLTPERITDIFYSFIENKHD